MMRNVFMTTQATHRPPRRRRAFSLAELMIAVVILGVGLLMEASMFPIAWTKARDQIEETNVGNAVTSAEAIVNTKFRIARFLPDVAQGFGDDGFSANPPGWTWQSNIHDCFTKGQTSFPGDLGIFPRGGGFHGTDNRVHPLNAYNLAADPTVYESAAAGIDWLPALMNEAFVPDEPHLLETADAMAIVRNVQGARSVPEPQVLLEARLLPAQPLKLEPRGPNAVPSSASDQALVIDNWYARLRGRRYAWAALVRLNNGDALRTTLDQEGITYDSMAIGGLNRATWDDPRVFTVYYATLRRTQSGSRFPRQEFRNGEGQDWPPVIPDGTVAEPQAMPAAFDTVLPTPWRVQVYVPNPVDTTDANAVRGVPGEVIANSGSSDLSGETGDIVTKILPRGAWFIDELSGQVYTVTRRRLYDNDSRAILTVDKEITREDLAPNRDLNEYIEDRDRLRTVWVYPPPAEAARLDGKPVFEGVQPVIGIETRTLVVRP